MSFDAVSNPLTPLGLLLVERLALPLGQVVAPLRLDPAGIALHQGVEAGRRGRAVGVVGLVERVEPLAEVEVLVLEGVGELVHERRLRRRV